MKTFRRKDDQVSPQSSKELTATFEERRSHCPVPAAKVKEVLARLLEQVEKYGLQM